MGHFEMEDITLAVKGGHQEGQLLWGESPYPSPHALLTEHGEVVSMSPESPERRGHLTARDPRSSDLRGAAHETKWPLCQGPLKLQGGGAGNWVCGCLRPTSSWISQKCQSGRFSHGKGTFIGEETDQLGGTDVPSSFLNLVLSNLSSP